MNDIRIPTGALVLVGDGRKALFLRNRGNPHKVELVTEHVLEQNNPATREQGADRPGRAHGSDGNARSAMEETDWHQLAEDRFADDIADALYRMAHAQQFDELVVVAPPKVLGILRGAWHKEVSSRIVAEVPKDLTTHSIPEVSKLLS